MVVIVAHRLSTVKNADQIVVLENGKLLEEGTHQSLYKGGTLYYNMWQKQMQKMN